MAHFIRVRTSGFWTTNSTLLSTEMESFDAQLYKAVNGDDGGVWAPSSIIEIGGSGLKVTGVLTITGAATFSGGVTANEVAITGDLTVQTNATIQGYLTAETDTEVQGALDVTGATTLSGGATVTGGDLSVALNLAVQGNADVTGDLTADGASVETLGIHSAVAPGEVFTADGAGSFTSDLAVGGALAVTGAATVGGNASVTGTLTVTGTTIAKGRFRRRVRTMGNAGETVSVSDYDIVYMPPGVMSADRTLTISTSGAVEGDVIRVVAKDTTYALDVDWGDDVASLKRAADKQDWLELTFIGSVWVKTGTGDRSALLPLPAYLVVRCAVEIVRVATHVARSAAIVALLLACRRPRAPTAPRGVRVAGRTRSVAAAVVLADLSALATTGTGARLLLAWRADLRW